MAACGHAHSSAAALIRSALSGLALQPQILANSTSCQGHTAVMHACIVLSPTSQSWLKKKTAEAWAHMIAGSDALYACGQVLEKGALNVEHDYLRAPAHT